jgi:hypothetical protein
MQRKDPAALLKLQQAFEQGGDRRPPLHQWMSSNHDELVALFDGARLNWVHLTSVFADMGFQNGSGGKLKPETVRQTWYRVRKHHAAKRTRKATRPSLASVEVISTPASIPQQLPSPAPPLKPPAAPADDPMAALLAEMNRRSGRI